MNLTSQSKKPYLIGFITAGALLLFYVMTMRLLSGSWEVTYSQFKKLWYFMLPLSIGFGVQVGLYTKLRNLTQNASSKGVITANTTTSTVGMIACCAHHLTDVAPLIGISALSLFLVEFQTPILILGIISNTLGTVYLLKTLKRLNPSSTVQ